MPAIIEKFADISKQKPNITRVLLFARIVYRHAGLHAGQGAIRSTLTRQISPALVLGREQANTQAVNFLTNFCNRLVWTYLVRFPVHAQHSTFL